MVVKETRLSYVDELVAIMNLGWHSSAHLLSKSAKYSDILILIKSINFIGTIRTLPSQICISTRKDLFAQQEGMVLLYFLVQLKQARLPPSDLVLFYLSCVRSTIRRVASQFFLVSPRDHFVRAV